MGNEKWQIERKKNTEEQKNRKSEIPTWMILTTSRSYIFPNIYIDCFYVSIINLKKIEACGFSCIKQKHRKCGYI